MAAPKREIIVVAPDAIAAAIEAARRVVATISDSKRPAVCLTGGSSPKRLYEMLGDPSLKDAIPWDKVDWFIGDDRFVPSDHHFSNMGMARRIFLDRCAPAGRIHPMPTGEGNPDWAALRYQRELQAFYGSDRLDVAKPLFDVVLMGVGADGHTASLFPGSSFDDDTRWVVGVAEANVAPFVPRVTLTYPTLASC